jgi:broad-specificity NMP kinase
MLFDTSNTVASNLSFIRVQLSEIIKKLGVIMSEDAAVEAVVTDIQAQETSLAAVMQSVSATVATLLSEATANNGNISAATLAALQAEQAKMDAAVAAAQAQASTEAAEVPPLPPPPPAP